MATQKPVRKSARSTPPSKSEAAATLGRLGGKAGTPAQDAARRENAQSAGRPRRVCIKCLEPVIGGHRNRKLDETCGAHGWRWQSRADADKHRKKTRTAKR